MLNLELSVIKSISVLWKSRSFWQSQKDLYGVKIQLLKFYDVLSFEPDTSSSSSSSLVRTRCWWDHNLEILTHCLVDERRTKMLAKSILVLRPCNWSTACLTVVLVLEHMTANVHLVKFMYEKLPGVFQVRGHMCEPPTYYQWWPHHQHIEASHEYACRPVCLVHHASEQQVSKWGQITESFKFIKVYPFIPLLLRINNTDDVCFQVKVTPTKTRE